jgi:predicted alpha/beta hydrolase family esterase
MKRAVILHGTDGTPEANWFPWLRSKLEEQGYEVWVPLLPGNHTPNRQVYGDFLFNSGWDFTDNIVVGHSSGAVEVLNLLMDERSPHIRLGVMAGAWATNDAELSDVQLQAYQGAGLTKDQFKDTFPSEGFDFELIKSKADKLAFLHGSDDPYCPLEQAKWLAEQLGAPITVVPNGHHLGTKFTELPELWSLIKTNERGV